jgi:UDP-2,3-diacylglucosamine pyrophosphatase LpxH
MGIYKDEYIREKGVDAYAEKLKQNAQWRADNPDVMAEYREKRSKKGDGKENTVLFIGDLHLGSESVDVDKIKHLAKKYWSKHPIILMGDLADFGVKKPMLYQNILKPQEQVDLISEILKPLDIRAFCIGNHCNRLFKEVGINIWITVFEMQPSNSIEINGRIIFFNHGSSSASSAFLEYNKYIYSVKGSVIALGHSHLLAKKTILRQGEMTHLVRTGGFLGRDFYVKMAGYAEQLKGWPEFDTVNNVVHLRAWNSETEEVFDI